MNDFAVPTRRGGGHVSLAMLAVAVFGTAGLGVPARAATAPSALQAGPNSGSADSFVGPHTWYFQAAPGTFAVTVDATGTSQDSAPVGGSFAVRVAFAPDVKGDRFTAQQTPTGLVVRGTVVRAARVLVTIVPANSPLVRVARNYEIQATGNVAFASGAASDPIVGPYIAKRNAYGATRFNPNGTVATSDGQQGRWVLFDAQLRIYTVTIGGDRMTLKLVPGRGLIEASNDVVLFESAR